MENTYRQQETSSGQGGVMTVCIEMGGGQVVLHFKPKLRLEGGKLGGKRQDCYAEL